jgi:UDP-N-acetylglucosamine 2-epimerase (non-hydrolysing)
MDVGTLIMTGLKKERVLEALEITISQYVKDTRITSPVSDYESSISVSKQILRVVVSYVDYINRTVWSK